ncbi:hypothetical protein Avbf_16139 [Armadillidium vulgare]|nr:hypothetical protein Avbf_16139 [Armadillidium vulgare]
MEVKEAKWCEAKVELLEYWQPRIEKKNKREPIYTIKTYTHPITNFTNLLTMEGRKFFTDYPTCVYFACLQPRLLGVSQRIRQSQGQSLLFNNLGSYLIIQSWVNDSIL